jgi:hypothetical protein
MDVYTDEQTDGQTQANVDNGETLILISTGIY